MLSTDQLLHFQTKLQNLKQQLTQNSQKTLENLMEPDHPGGDSLDRTINEQTNATNLKFKERDLRRIQQINLALNRIHDGSYGFCTECQEEIPLARLQANPATPLCIDCQEELDQQNRRNYTRPGLLDD